GSLRSRLDEDPPAVHAILAVPPGRGQQHPIADVVQFASRVQIETGAAELIAPGCKLPEITRLMHGVPPSDLSLPGYIDNVSRDYGDIGSVLSSPSGVERIHRQARNPAIRRPSVSGGQSRCAPKAWGKA